MSPLCRDPGMAHQKSVLRLHGNLESHVITKLIFHLFNRHTGISAKKRANPGGRTHVISPKVVPPVVIFFSMSKRTYSTSINCRTLIGQNRSHGAQPQSKFLILTHISFTICFSLRIMTWNLISVVRGFF